MIRSHSGHHCASDDDPQQLSADRVHPIRCPTRKLVQHTVSVLRHSVGRLLETATRDEFRAELASHATTLTLPEVRRLIDHGRNLGPLLADLRLGIVHTYTSDLLDPWIELSAVVEGLGVQIHHAPYGLALSETQVGSALVRHAPDVTLLLLQREDLHPQLLQPLAAITPDEQSELLTATLEKLFDLVQRYRLALPGHLVLTLLPALAAPGLGLYDAQSERSESAWWARFKAHLGQRLREESADTLFLDLDEVLLEFGRTSMFDARLWHAARYPFTAQSARELARRVVAVGAVLKLPRAKVIALDADNTLWGGIVGEDGPTGIALGPEYPGSAYLEFQRRLLAFRQRGFVLVLCSKNNPEDVDDVLKTHPHQLLKSEHFAARRVNWLPKPENLASLAEELNLGLDAFVFVDDNSHECALVRSCLPQVEVVQVPNRLLAVPTCLDRVARLEVLSLTAEDMAKTAMYADEKRRRDWQQRFANSGLGDYLNSLQMKMMIGIDDALQVKRLAQLTQKTNQFNLTTRRYDEQQMLDFMRATDWLVAHFSLTDIFGDSGVVGLALIRLEAGSRAVIDTFLMSCRVIGRDAEKAFLHALLRLLHERGIDRVTAEYIPTPKNRLIEDFLPKQGFTGLAQGHYERDLGVAPPLPSDAFPIKVMLQSIEYP
jgi:FkbH-like protein